MYQSAAGLCINLFNTQVGPNGPEFEWYPLSSVGTARLKQEGE